MSRAFRASSNEETSAVKTLKRVFLLFAMPVEIVISSIYVRFPIFALSPLTSVLTAL